MEFFNHKKFLNIRLRDKLSVKKCT